jgi:hypothetical protein
VEEHHHQVAEAERDAVSVVRLRDRERDHEESAHPADQEQPKPEPVGGDRIRQPRVPVVHPPDQEQHHDHLGDRRGTLSLDEDAGQLRDREDEDEIEEELERRDANASLGRGHDRIIVEEGLAKCGCAVGPRCSPRGGVLSRPDAEKHRGSLRPCLGTTIAPRRRANSAKPS